MEQFIKNKAIELGFDLVGITTAEPLDSIHISRFERWLKQDCPSGLSYMRRNIKKRFHPARLMDSAKSIVCVGLNYKPIEKIPVPVLKIANYALYEDYHTFIKKTLFQLAEWISKQIPNPKTTKFKVCVDTAPLAEKALAQRAGLGFIGKNHLLIHPEIGIQILLGFLLVNIELKPDKTMDIDGCKSCTRCLQACPTNALLADGRFCTNRCISYNTQYQSEESNFQRTVCKYIYGCDQCILACPYNKNAPVRTNSNFRFFSELLELKPQDILGLNQEEYKEYLHRSSILHIGLEKLKKNVQMVLDNQK